MTTAVMASEVGLSVGEAHNALKRAVAAQLLRYDGKIYTPVRRSIEEFLLYGLKYVFIVERGELVRGVPTAHAAPPLNALISSGDDAPPVWADPQGTVRGYSVSPLYSSIPEVSKRDPQMYEWFALIDAIRIGMARERRLAQEILQDRLMASA
jgi:hypothetical protein